MDWIDGLDGIHDCRSANDTNMHTTVYLYIIMLLLTHLLPAILAFQRQLPTIRSISSWKQHKAQPAQSRFRKLKWSSSRNDNDDRKRSQPVLDQEASIALGAWVPVGSASSLSGITPFRVQIMNQDFVVWDSTNKKSNQEEWSVFLDSCSHRLAPLSLGRVDPLTNCLECPYHGWQFNSTGSLTRVPQLDPDKQSLSALQESGSAKSFPVHLTGDLIWTFLPSSMHGEAFPISVLPQDYFPGVAQDMERGAALYSSHEMPASMDITVENGIDPSHFPFSHHGVISKRSDAGPMPDMKTVVSNFTHLDIYASYMRNGVPRERLYSFQRPFLLCTQERDEINQWKQAAKFFIVPIREGRCRIITCVPKLSKRWFPNWLTHVLVTRLFIGDLFLHDTERSRQDPSAGKTYFQPTLADESTRAWQRWHSKFGFANSPPHTFRSASYTNLQQIPRRDQEDKWLSHTYSCSHCRKALKIARTARVATAVIGLLLAFLLSQRNHPIWATTIGLLGLLGSWVASKVQAFHEGTIRPSDASDRSWSLKIHT